MGYSFEGTFHFKGSGFRRGAIFRKKRDEKGKKGAVQINQASLSLGASDKRGVALYTVKRGCGSNGQNHY